MADLLVTLFKFRQFVSEFGPFLLAVWLMAGSLGAAVDGVQRFLSR
jgi:hypothetical protein